MQSLHSAITPPAPPAPRHLSKSPTSRQVEKPTSWQVGKLASWQTLPPSPAPPTRAGCPSFLSYPAGKSPPPSRIAAKPPPPCIPAALAASFSLTPPVNQCPPAPSPLLPPRERSPSYPGVNQPHLCYTTHQRETPALRSPPPDPPHPVITQQPCARRCIVPVHHTTLPPLPTAPTLRISPSP